MKSIPKHYELVQEHPNSYEIHDSRDKKNFHVAKSSLDLAMHAKLSKIKKYAGGGDVEADVPESAEPDQAAAAPVTVNVATPPPQSAPVQEAQPMPAAVAPVPAPAAPMPTRAPAATTDLVAQARGAQAVSEKGIQEKALAEGQTSAANAQALEANNARQQALMEGYNKSRTALDLENQSLTRSVLEGKIDPERWWHNKSTGGKISTAIGLIVSGIGQGLSGANTNMALEAMHQHVRDDIESQKADLGKKQSLLSMNLEKYRNLDAATQATMNQMNALIQGQLQLNAAKTGSQLAKANAHIATGELRSKFLTELPDLALKAFKIDALHGLMGETPPPTAGQKILAPGVTAPANGSKPADGAPARSDESASAEPGLRSGVTPDMVDLPKLFKLKTADILKGEDITAANKEASDIQQSHAVKQLITREFERMTSAVNDSPDFGLLSGGVGLRRLQDVLSKAPLIGPMVGESNSLGGKQGRQFAAARANAADLINGFLTKRIGGEAMQNLKLDLPTGQESSEEVQDKLQRIYDLVDRNTLTPVLDQYGLIRRKKAK